MERVSKVYPVADFGKAIADMMTGTVRLPATGTSRSCADTHRSSNQSSSSKRVGGNCVRQTRTAKRGLFLYEGWTVIVLLAQCLQLSR